MVGKAVKATENLSVSVETKWPGLEKCSVKNVFPRSGLSNLATLGQTTVRSRKKKFDLGKEKVPSRKRKFAFEFFQLRAVSFQQHGTYILCTKVKICPVKQS